MKKIILKSIFSIVIVFFTVGSFANKTSVKIDAPEKAKKGEEVIIKIQVKHVGNSKKHYTDWVWVKVNGEEVKKWEYTPKTLPDDQNFTLELKLKAEKDMEIVAEGNCNKHGSKGKDKVKIIVE